MGTKILQFIKKSRILLLAAVLFCLSLSLANPVRGIEQVIFLNINQSQTITEQASDKASQKQEMPSSGTMYLAVNSPSIDISDQDSSIQESSLAAFNESALLAQTNPTTFISQEPRTGVITYTVQEGDSASSIAAFFGITTNTLLWANDLKELSIIRPGDELIILPVTGVLHRVKDNQTISSIANLYDADSEEIIAFNNLPADGSIQIGDKLIIPDGIMPSPVSYAPTRVVSQSYSGSGTGVSHVFPYGQCTWYVAQKRVVPWSGHAKSWLANAQAYGYQTGAAPQVGAIIVTRESWYGHVGYVEAVKGEWVTFSEMNHLGWGIKSVRTLHINDWKIRGYIY
jgi:LysM repeat protein